MLWITEPKCTPARASSSSTAASWAKLPPPPPYASGTSGSSTPARPALVQASASGRCCARQRSCCGTNSFSTNWRTLRRNICTSSPVQRDRYAGAAISAASVAYGRLRPAEIGAPRPDFHRLLRLGLPPCLCVHYRRVDPSDLPLGQRNLNFGNVGLRNPVWFFRLTRPAELRSNATACRKSTTG